jgi:hypothetical protein
MKILHELSWLWERWALRLLLRCLHGFRWADWQGSEEEARQKVLRA